MPAALRSVIESDYPSKTPISRARKNQNKGRVSARREPEEVRAQKIEKLPKRADVSIPVWWRSLLLAHRVSSVLTFFLIAFGSILYGMTVYTEKLWSKKYQELETLQRYERQLIATNETLKDRMARQAEQSGTDLLPPNPERAVFLNPSSQYSVNQFQTVKKIKNASLTNVPPGY